MSEEKNTTPSYCFVCGSKLQEAFLGILKCSDKDCDSIYLPFVDKNGNQNMMLGEDKEPMISYDLAKKSIS